MISKRITLTLIVTILISFSLACAFMGGTDPTPDISSDEVIATSVAATIAADHSEDASSEKSLPTIQPTIQPSATASAPEANFRYTGVSFYFNDLLAEDIVAGVNPGQYDENNPWWSYPEHRSFRFNNWVLSDAFHEARIRIYPVVDFKAINENVSEGLESLDAALKSEPLDADALRVPNMFNAGQLFHSNARALRFQNGYGARWLSQYGQAYSTVGWPYLFYTFQGFSDDGKYYISIIFPVDHPSLLDPEDVNLDDAFYENIAEYMEETRLTLESESENSFVPSLVLLDQLVSSLTVGEP